ncbi:MAG: hypothetical protein PWR21_1653 [Methanoculleus sp.]|nr:hypothetical protein [Methanoculleus sp.]
MRPPYTARRSRSRGGACRDESATSQVQGRDTVFSFSCLVDCHMCPRTDFEGTAHLEASRLLVLRSSHLTVLTLRFLRTIALRSIALRTSGAQTQFPKPFGFLKFRPAGHRILRTVVLQKKFPDDFHCSASQCLATNSRTICAATAAVCPESNGATST